MRAALSPTSPTLTITMYISYESEKYSSTLFLFSHIHGRLGPTETGPTPSHELKSSVRPRAIEVESTRFPVPVPDLDDGPTVQREPFPQPTTFVHIHPTSAVRCAVVQRRVAPPSPPLPPSPLAAAGRQTPHPTTPAVEVRRDGAAGCPRPNNRGRPAAPPRVAVASKGPAAAVAAAASAVGTTAAGTTRGNSSLPAARAGEGGEAPPPPLPPPAWP